MSPTRPTFWVREYISGYSTFGGTDFWSFSGFSLLFPLDIGQTVRRVFLQGSINPSIAVEIGTGSPNIEVFEGFDMRIGVAINVTADILTDPPAIDVDPTNPDWALMLLMQRGTVDHFANSIQDVYSRADIVGSTHLMDSHTNRGPASGLGAAAYFVWDIQSLDGDFWMLDGTAGVTGQMFGGFWVHMLVEDTAA